MDEEVCMYTSSPTFTSFTLPFPHLHPRFSLHLCPLCAPFPLTPFSLVPPLPHSLIPPFLTLLPPLLHLLLHSLSLPFPPFHSLFPPSPTLPSPSFPPLLPPSPSFLRPSQRRMSLMRSCFPPPSCLPFNYRWTTACTRNREQCSPNQ